MRDLVGPSDARVGHSVRRELGELLQTDRDRAACRAQPSGQEVDERRLARSIGADEPDQLAGRDRQSQAVEGAHATEVPRQLDAFDDRCRLARCGNLRALRPGRLARLRSGRRRQRWLHDRLRRPTTVRRAARPERDDRCADDADADPVEQFVGPADYRRTDGEDGKAGEGGERSRSQAGLQPFRRGDHDESEDRPEDDQSPALEAGRP